VFLCTLSLWLHTTVQRLRDSAGPYMYICMCMCVCACHNVHQLFVNTFICVTMHVHCAFSHTYVPRRRDKQVLVCIQFLHACVCARARLHVCVCVRVFMCARTCTIHRCPTNRPPHKLSGGGFSAPVPIFCLTCTSSNELKSVSDMYH